MTPVRQSEAELRQYINSREFRRRLKRTAKRQKAGEQFTPEEIAEAWGLPVEILLGGYERFRVKQGQN